MKLSKYLLVLPIFVMALTATAAAKSVTEISRKPTSGKYLTKLMSMKKQKSKPKTQRKSARLPKMGFLPGNSYHSMVEDQMLSNGPRQDLASILGATNHHRQDMVGLLNGGASRLSGVENSPVYYVRLPPTPYMYTPGLGYISQQASPMANALRAENYQANSVNSFMNLPVNFMANGQPNGAYEFSMPELMSSAFPGKGFLRQEPPIFGRRQFLVDDSKFSTLKGRYDFNGRPEGLIVLPESAYYQSNMFK